MQIVKGEAREKRSFKTYACLAYAYYSRLGSSAAMPVFNKSAKTLANTKENDYISKTTPQLTSMQNEVTNRPTYYPFRFVGWVIITLLIAMVCMLFETIIGHHSFGTEDPIEFFSHEPNLLLWTFMAMIQIVFALSVIPFIWQKIKQIIATYNINKIVIRNIIIVIGLFICLTITIQELAGRVKVTDFLDAYCLVNHAWFKMGAVVVCSYAAIIMCTYLILLINAVFNNLSGEGPMLYLQYRPLKVMMQNILNIIGIIITTSTVATVILQKALDNYPGNRLTPTMVYAYGLFNTFYIAIIYLPVFFNMKATGRKLADMELEKESGTLTSEQFLAKKKVLVEIFGLEQDYTEIFKKAVPILGPLLASLFAMKG